MMRRSRSIASVAALLVLVAAVAIISAAKKNDASAVAQGSAPTAETVVVPDAGKLGTPIGRFTISDIDGAQVSVPADGRPGAVWFFAGWCGECIPEGRALAALQERFGGRVTITAISPDPTDSVDAIKRFRTNVGDPEFSFVWSRDAALGTAYRATALDTTIIYDAAGDVVFRDAGPSTTEDLLAAFARAGLT